MWLEKLRKEVAAREAAKTPEQRAAEKEEREREKLRMEFVAMAGDRGRAFGRKLRGE